MEHHKFLNGWMEIKGNRIGRITRIVTSNMNDSIDIFLNNNTIKEKHIKIINHYREYLRCKYSNVMMTFEEYYDERKRKIMKIICFTLWK
jgi:hypothetical protein